MLSYVAYFWHFLLKQKNTWSPVGSPAKLTLGKSCIWASLCFKLFVGLVAYIGPGFNFLGSSSFLGSGSWKRMCGGEYLHQACSPLRTFQGWSLILFLVRCECPRSLVPLLLSGQFPRNGNVIPAAGPKHASALSGWDCCFKSQTPCCGLLIPLPVWAVDFNCLIFKMPFRAKENKTKKWCLSHFNE